LRVLAHRHRRASIISKFCAIERHARARGDRFGVGVDREGN
jgi:hypothetical protein